MDLMSAIRSAKKHVFQPDLPPHLSHLEHDEELNSFINQKYLSLLTTNHLLNLHIAGQINDQEYFMMRENLASESGVQQAAAEIFGHLLEFKPEKTKKR